MLKSPIYGYLLIALSFGALLLIQNQLDLISLLIIAAFTTTTLFFIYKENNKLSELFFLILMFAASFFLWAFIELKIQNWLIGDNQITYNSVVIAYGILIASSFLVSIGSTFLYFKKMQRDNRFEIGSIAVHLFGTMVLIFTKIQF